MSQLSERGMIDFKGGISSPPKKHTNTRCDLSVPYALRGAHGRVLSTQQSSPLPMTKSVERGGEDMTASRGASAAEAKRLGEKDRHVGEPQRSAACPAFRARLDIGAGGGGLAGGKGQAANAGVGAGVGFGRRGAQKNCPQEGHRK